MLHYFHRLLAFWVESLAQHYENISKLSWECQRDGLWENGFNDYSCSGDGSQVIHLWTYLRIRDAAPHGIQV